MPLSTLSERREGFVPGRGPRPRSRPQPTGYLFLPSRLRRANFLIWLPRTHAWLGLWGVALALLFGSTGILLNHRATMKIPAAKVKQSVIQFVLPEPRPADAPALARWLRVELKVDKPPMLVKVEPAQTVVWNGEAVRQPQLWGVFFASPQRTFNAEYWQDNAFAWLLQ